MITAPEEVDLHSVSPEPTPAECDATRTWDHSAILIDGAFFSLMVGLGETNFATFALALGAMQAVPKLAIATGLLAAIPMFVGATLQLITPFAVRRLGSNRRWVVAAIGTQAVCLVFMPLVMFAGSWSLPLLFVMVAWYWASGLSGGPSWNTWMEEIVPVPIRSHFFARRVRNGQFCLMLGLIIGGFTLEFGKRGDWLMPAFFAVFWIAAAARVVSTWLLFSTHEPEAAKEVARTHVGFTELIRKLRGHGGMKMLWFLFAMQASVQISGPYFVPFMFREMKMSYGDFMWLIGVAYLGKVLSLQLWGRVAHRYGAKTLLWIGSVWIVPGAAVWIGLWWVDSPMVYLSIIQIIGNIPWAAYELAFFLLFFEAIPHEERTSLLTIYNFGNAAAMLVGATIGALWLGFCGEAFNVYLYLFGISSLARLTSLLLLRRI